MYMSHPKKLRIFVYRKVGCAVCCKKIPAPASNKSFLPPLPGMQRILSIFNAFKTITKILTLCQL